ncbi:MAG TPA: aminotransferase class IV [Wenzhouxiangella sp.]
MSTQNTLVDGEFLDAVPATDRGFLFGDHVFETMLWNGQSIPLWSFHWHRLHKSCQRLGFVAPSEEVLLADVQRLMGLIPEPKASILRLTVTRGSSATGYWIPDNLSARRVLQVRDLPASIAEQQEVGLRVKTASMRLPSTDFGQGLKHGNRLLQVMCAQECGREKMDEVIIYRDNGTVAEAMASNVILVGSGQLISPDDPEVWGVGLEWLGTLDLGLEMRRITRSDIECAEEVLLINSVAGVRPVVELDDRALAIGKTCRQLQVHWRGLYS